MNDIEVLEKKIKISRELFEEVGTHIFFDEDLMDIAERLLNRIKDLEEINEAHKKENGELREELEKQQSLIKEKIEELKEQFEDYGKRWEEAGMDKAHPFYKYLIRIEAEIDILEELLKGE